MSASILIADGEEVCRQNIKEHANSHGCEVIEALDKNNAVEICKSKKPDIIVIGSYTKNSHDGLKLAKLVRRQNKKIPIILIAKKSSEALAIAALKIGVNDYVKVPSSYEALIESIERILSDHKLKPPEADDSDIVGDSCTMREIKSYLTKIATVDSTVLITGETGTGKELFAEMIHQKSARTKKPFVCINCAALPESLIESELFGYERGAFTGAFTAKKGKFALASSGTLFLDEIGDMSIFAQAKVLRTIENKAVYPLGGLGAVPLDVRVIAATNQDPEALMREGKFRQDLYYRLNVARVHLPPLRDRKEDIPDLISLGIQKLNQRFDHDLKGFSDEAMASLFQYDWPGNVRELNNLVEASFISCSSKKIEFVDLPQAFTKQLKFSDSCMTNEKDTLLAALCATRWNKSEAAKKLKWSRMKVYRALKRYKITSQTVTFDPSLH